MPTSTAVPSKRARLPREQRLGDIMKAARAVFVEKGYEEAAMSEIAARAGLVEGSLYRFFNTKKDLLFAVMEAAYIEMLSDYDRQLAGITGVRNRLRFMIWRLLVAIQENPVLTRLMHRHVLDDAAYLETGVHEQNRIYGRHLDDIIQDGIGNGELREDTPLWLVRQLILGAIDQLTWRHRVGISSFDPDEAADQIADIVYRSMAQSGSDGKDPDRLTDLANRLEKNVEKLEAITEAKVP